jgi:hypothetical protein
MYSHDIRELHVRSTLNRVLGWRQIFHDDSDVRLTGARFF